VANKAAAMRRRGNMRSVQSGKPRILPQRL
jgi:hypothetical protein